LEEHKCHANPISGYETTLRELSFFDVRIAMGRYQDGAGSRTYEKESQ
jgi:hypothetical protein